MAIKQPHEVSERTRDRVEDLLGRLNGEQVSQWVMDELFSAEEREVAARYAKQKNEQRRLDPNQAEKRDRLPHAVHLYAHVRRLDQVVAALDLGYMRQVLTPQDYDSLRRELGIDQLDDGVDLRRAVQDADLVLDEFRLLGIWRGQSIEFPGPDDVKWNYFWRLTSAARNGRSIGPEDFSCDTQSRNLSDWKLRLREMDGFPHELWKRIVVTAGRHRLDVPRETIRVFPMTPPGAPA